MTLDRSGASETSLTGRILVGAYDPFKNGTGVSTYSRLIADALQARGLTPLFFDAAPPRSRWSRRVRAVAPWPRRALIGGHVIRQQDVFREAQVFFDIHRRPLEITVPGPAGIAHWCYPFPVKINGWTNVYTVHDAIPLVTPHLTSIDPYRHRRLLTALARDAARFITVSEAARSEIVGALDCAPDFVINLGEPVEPLSIGPGMELPAGLVRNGYFLHCGTIEPRKNLERLAEAHARSGVAQPLVLAGPAGWQAEGILARLRERPNIVHLDYVDRRSILNLIQMAKALLMPSLAEGFGLPVAEAMALGTPVLTSNRGALFDTAGGAALLVDVEDVGAIAAGIRQLALDEELCQGLQTKGRVRASAFHLDAFARRLCDFYLAIER